MKAIEQYFLAGLFTLLARNFQSNENFAKNQELLTSFAIFKFRDFESWKLELEVLNFAIFFF